MIKKASVALALALLALSLSAADTANRLSFPLAGFSITPLDATPGESPSQTAIMMFLPPDNKFAANVNVMVQSYSGTLDDYTALTVQQFKDANLKVISQKKLGASAIIFEYSGLMQGNPLHWYSRAEKSGTHVYLTTATSSESQWPKQAAQLKSCVDSFRCEKR